jgi:hypothetical protein
MFVLETTFEYIPALFWFMKLTSNIIIYKTCVKQITARKRFHKRLSHLTTIRKQTWDRRTNKPIDHVRTHLASYRTASAKIKIENSWEFLMIVSCILLFITSTQSGHPIGKMMNDEIYISWLNIFLFSWRLKLSTTLRFIRYFCASIIVKLSLFFFKGYIPTIVCAILSIRYIKQNLNKMKFI